MRYEIALVTAAYFRELLGKKQGVLYEDHQAGDLYGMGPQRSTLSHGRRWESSGIDQVIPLPVFSL